MEEILQRLEQGLYREIRIARYSVRCDPKAERAGLPYFYVCDNIAEEPLNAVRYQKAWESEREAERLNRQEGLVIIDVEADIRKLLSLLEQSGACIGKDPR